MFPKYFQCTLSSILVVSYSAFTLNYILTDNEKNNIRLKKLNNQHLQLK